MMKKNFKKRSRSYYRNQRKRVIAKKMFICNTVFGNNMEDLKSDKRCYSKAKVHCSCRMCKYEKFYGIEKYKYKASKKQFEKDKRVF